MRWFFISVLATTGLFLFLQGRWKDRNDELPVFLRTDKRALAHHTQIQTTIHSLYRPDSLQLETLKKDYANAWAHLNYLYATNNVEAGKEYYTEDWFKQMVRHYNGKVKTNIIRYDEQHHLHIQNWASDGLACTAIDSNLVFKTIYPGNKIRRSRVHLAVVLLFQGDHWRIDALRVLRKEQL